MLTSPPHVRRHDFHRSDHTYHYPRNPLHPNRSGEHPHSIDRYLLSFPEVREFGMYTAYSDASRSDRNNDGGGYSNGGDSLGVNGYSAGGAGRERRPGGYGGFYADESQQPSSLTSPSRSRDGWRTQRDDTGGYTSRTGGRGRSDTASSARRGARGPQAIEGTAFSFASFD